MVPCSSCAIGLCPSRRAGPAAQAPSQPPCVTSEVMTRRRDKPPCPPSVRLWVGWGQGGPACTQPAGSVGSQEEFRSPLPVPIPKQSWCPQHKTGLLHHWEGAVPRTPLPERKRFLPVGLPCVHMAVWLGRTPMPGTGQEGCGDLAWLQSEPQQTSLGETPALKLCFGFLLQGH